MLCEPWAIRDQTTKTKITVAQARALLPELKASDLSLAEFARQRGIASAPLSQRSGIVSTCQTWCRSYLHRARLRRRNLCSRAVEKGENTGALRLSGGGRCRRPNRRHALGRTLKGLRTEWRRRGVSVSHEVGGRGGGRAAMERWTGKSEPARKL